MSFYLEEMTISTGYSFEDWLAEVSEYFVYNGVANFPRFYDFHKDYLMNCTPSESYIGWLES